MILSAFDQAGTGEPTAAELELALMERNGITRVQIDQYHADGYRYTNLADALAQVGRGSRAKARARAGS